MSAGCAQVASTAQRSAGPSHFGHCDGGNLPKVASAGPSLGSPGSPFQNIFCKEWRLRLDSQYFRFFSSLCDEHCRHSLGLVFDP